MTDWVSYGSRSFSSKYKLTFISLALIHTIPPQHWKPTFISEFGCVYVLFIYEGPSVRKTEDHGPFLSLTLVAIKRAFTHYDTSFHCIQGLIVPWGVAENMLTDELLLTLRAFIWISFHLCKHYGLNMEQTRFCVPELVRYGAVLNRAHLQTCTYLRLSHQFHGYLVRNGWWCTHKTHSAWQKWGHLMKMR